MSWSEVEGAGCYMVVMFDEDANWLHWFVGELTQTELEQGAYNNAYVGPYPPNMVGRHNYCIEVFALRQAPDAVVAKMDARNAYPDIVGSFDTAGGSTGNILARGYVVGTYAHGDNNQ